MKKGFLLTILSLMISFMSFAIFPITGPAGVCTGDTTILYDSTAGGVWSSSDISVATVSPISGYTRWANLTGVAAGTAIITYDVSGVYSTLTVTVTPAPAPITGVTSICAGATAPLSDATPGGTWSSSYPSYVSVGVSTGIITGILGGADIYYNVGPGCAAIAHVIVNTTNAGILSGDSSACVGSTLATLSDAVSGGTWTSGNTSIATVGISSGTITGIAPGSTTITYTVTDACGSASVHVPVYVSNTTIPGTITGPSSIYVSKSSYYYSSGGLYGGTWSTSNPAIATISSSTATGVSPGTVIITYSVTGCGGPAYTTTVVNVIPLNSISGNINFTGTTYVGGVKVWLITYNPATFDLEALDSVNVYCGSGSGSTVQYEFLGAPTDSFRVKAAVNDSIYMPTYHNTSFYWYAASVFVHTTGTVDVNKDITMNYGMITTGPGFIGGSVLSGANKGTSGGTPVKGMLVYLIDDVTGSTVKFTYTDASGNYSFSSLPLGTTYRIHPEAINYLSTDYTGITLTAASSSLTSVNFGQHTVSHSITPATAAVNELAQTSPSIHVFPNPSNGQLNIQYAAMVNETGSVIISDMAGRRISSTTINMNQGTGISELNLSNLSDGLYMISVKSESVNYNNKIQIAK